MTLSITVRDAAFHLESVREKIPCPRCGRKDCARSEITKGRQIAFCVTTWREVSPALLLQTARRLQPH